MPVADPSEKKAVDDKAAGTDRPSEAEQVCAGILRSAPDLIGGQAKPKRERLRITRADFDTALQL